MLFIIYRVVTTCFNKLITRHRVTGIDKLPSRLMHQHGTMRTLSVTDTHGLQLTTAATTYQQHFLTDQFDAFKN